MKIKKIDGQFNTYQMEMSYGELVALENSLSSGRSGPIADELYAGIKWYLDDDSKLPKPGQEKEDVKKGEEKKEEEAELPLPSPDEDLGGEGEPEDLGGDEGPEPEGEEEGPGGMEDLDKTLPPPEA